MNTHYKVTPTLYNSWLRWYEGTDTTEKFLSFLRGEPFERTGSMQKGLDFEAAVRERQVCTKVAIEWREGIYDSLALRILHHDYQQRVWKSINAHGYDVLLTGIVDWIDHREIVDLKWTSRYDWGKYLEGGIQHLIYPTCTDRRRFVYLVSDGEDVWEEPYYVSDWEIHNDNLELCIYEIILSLRSNNEVWETYNKHWMTSPEEYESRAMEDAKV